MTAERSSFTAEINISPLQEHDINSVAQAMVRMDATLAGLSSARAFRALLKDAIGAPDIVVIVARVEGRPVGVVFSVIDWNHFKKRFARRFPRLALELGFKRLLQRRKGRAGKQADNHQLSSIELTHPSEHASWADSGPDIAKTVFVGVVPELRGRAIAQKMYEEVATHLQERGVRRLDAHMNPGNVASIKAHARAGWRMSRDASGVFATVDLSNEASLRGDTLCD